MVFSVLCFGAHTLACVAGSCWQAAPTLGDRDRPFLCGAPRVVGCRRDGREYVLDYVLERKSVQVGGSCRSSSENKIRKTCTWGGPGLCLRHAAATGESLPVLTPLVQDLNTSITGKGGRYDKQKVRGMR